MSKEASKADLSQIRIALCGLNRQVLLPVRSELMELGYRSAEWIRSDEALRLWTQQGIPDLIVADHQLDDGAAVKTVREIRNGDLGANPFAVVIMTTWANDPENVREAINSGVDDLLVAPYSTGQLLERIKKLITDRKPFIATSDYVGPERRRDPARKSEIPTFEPPNTLRMRQEGEQVDAAALKEQIEASNTQIQEEKLRRIGFQISFLVDLALPKFGVGEFDQDTKEHLDRLAMMSGEAVQRLDGTQYEGISQLCKSMHKLAKRIAADPSAASADDVELLKPLSRAILEAFFPSESTGDLVSQIAGAINSYNDRKNRFSG
ncbi:response regulator [Nisaea acidiphila]|uniref:Response regulator n=1 Tax=Nisaea acidiphila TaxID=1862145 RepID=A0A9J7AS31_9PROT|nr:response regulator [Nisaea acidiphila]UUX50022.1 response regulator [Nisaea acidiphila]